MSDSQAGTVLAGTTGAVVLPNTSNGFLAVVSWVAIAAAAAVVVSFLATRALKRQ